MIMRPENTKLKTRAEEIFLKGIVYVEALRTFDGELKTRELSSDRRP
jgi:hypothetical protein